MQTFEFTASPWIDEAAGEIWEEAVSYFHRWLWLQYKGDYFYSYDVARRLGVHRDIADHWVGLVRSYEWIDLEFMDILPRNRSGEHEMHAYIMNEFPTEPAMPLVPKELKEFDPWTDRSKDIEIDNLRWPDHTIDKFYDITFDEVLATTGKRRRRPNGSLFVPVPYMELPRYASAKDWSARRRADAATANPEWRAATEALASAE